MSDCSYTRQMARDQLLDSIRGFEVELISRTLDKATTVTASAEREDLIAQFFSGRVPAVVAIGAFDGVHLGHQQLIEAAKSDANNRGVACVAVTFNPDPSDVVDGPTPLARLLAHDDRVSALIAAGADAVITMAFTPEVAQLTDREFIDQRLFQRLRPVAIHVGSDFRFGRDGAGSVDSLAAHGSFCNFEVVGHPLTMFAGKPITATRIRSTLREGQLTLAAKLLGRLHIVRGSVEHGRGQGSSFGFPTANLRCDALCCMPCPGVYSAFAVVAGGVAYAAAVNVGTPPTFTSVADPSFLEAHLVAYSGDLYECPLTIVFFSMIRTARRFSSLTELEATVHHDIRSVEHDLGVDPVLLGAVFG